MEVVTQVEVDDNIGFTQGVISIEVKNFKLSTQVQNTRKQFHFFSSFDYTQEH